MSDADRPGATMAGVRALAVLLLGVAAAASLVFMSNVAGGNPSVVLRTLFTVWVVLPFAAAAALTLVSGRMPTRLQVGIAVSSLVIAAASLAFYAGVIPLPRVKPAFVFLMVPLVSCCALVPWGVASMTTSRRKRT
jgi:hypothetical protein